MMVEGVRTRGWTARRGHAWRVVVRLGSMAAASMSTVLLGLIGTAVPVHAVAGGTDHLLIFTSRIDVGLFLDPSTQTFGEPGAQVQWREDRPSGTYDPRLFAVFEMKNASGYCGKVRFEVFDWNGDSIEFEESNQLCPFSAAARYLGADLLLDQPTPTSSVRQVVVSTWEKPSDPNVDYYETASVTHYP